jgi:hypothetical protein
MHSAHATLIHEPRPHADAHVRHGPRHSASLPVSRASLPLPSVSSRRDDAQTATRASRERVGAARARQSDGRVTGQGGSPCTRRKQTAAPSSTTSTDSPQCSRASAASAASAARTSVGPGGACPAANAAGPREPGLGGCGSRLARVTWRVKPRPTTSEDLPPCYARGPRTEVEGLHAPDWRPPPTQPAAEPTFPTPRTMPGT